MKQILIVGCPRSGTTILQAILSSHPEVFSLPETHFYPALCSSNRIIRGLGISTRRAKLILKDIEEQYLGKCHVKPSFFSKSLSKQYVNLLNEITQNKKFSHWIEKTPQNLWFLKFIKSFSNDFSFIHIEREPKDVIASIHHASTKHPESWGYSNLNDAIQLWRESHMINKEYRGLLNHFHCSYEELVKSPNSLIRKISDSLSLDFIKDLHLRYVNNKSEYIINGNEIWKNSVYQKLLPAKSKFHTHFTDIQQAKVLEAVNSFNDT